MKKETTYKNIEHIIRELKSFRKKIIEHDTYKNKNLDKMLTGEKSKRYSPEIKQWIHLTYSLEILEIEQAKKNLIEYYTKNKDFLEILKTYNKQDYEFLMSMKHLYIPDRL